jgi:hypothetical protein
MDSPALSKFQVESFGQRLLEFRLNAIVRHRILRDVLQLPPGGTDLETAHSQMLAHPWVEELAREQHPDGTWGRFHSMDSTIKARFPTTEVAIRRALALGLGKEDFILCKAIEFMQRVLERKSSWSDRSEKSEGWLIGVQAITAATLAQVNPVHPGIVPAWEYWAEIAERSFASGSYDPAAEWKAHKTCAVPASVTWAADMC